MEEETASGTKEKGRTNIKDVGKGLILLGAGILLLTAVFLALAFWDQEHYGLFSGLTHLTFDTVVGIVFMGTGFILVRKGEQRPAE